MAVVAGADKDQVRLEEGDGREDLALEAGQPLLSGGAAGKWHVQGEVAGPGPPTSGRRARAGEERPLVQRGVEDGGVVPEDLLRPVAVVHVDVDDGNPPHARARRITPLEMGTNE